MGGFLSLDELLSPADGEGLFAMISTASGGYKFYECWFASFRALIEDLKVTSCNKKQKTTQQFE